MEVEVDQSGKIEETNKNTILAFSDGIHGIILIKSQVKRQLLEIFRRQGKPKLFIYRVFAASVFLLLKPHLSSITTIIIDTEWTGKERLISDIFFEFIHKKKLRRKPNISFQFIGKHSSAHKLAWNTYQKIRGKKRVKVKLLTLQEIALLAAKPQKMTEVEID